MSAWLRSLGAVVAGFATVVVLSTAADAALTAMGIFPSHGKPLSDPLFALAAAYRCLFTAVGGYLCARIAPNHPWRHAGVLAGIGLLAGVGGVVAYYQIGGPEMGPAWYAISIPVTAIPCVLGGAWVAVRGRAVAT